MLFDPVDPGNVMRHFLPSCEVLEALVLRWKVREWSTVAGELAAARVRVA